MSKRMNITIMLIIMLVVSWPTYSVSAQTPGRATVYINNQAVTTTIILQNNYQLVPASFFRKLNVSVQWSSQYNAAVMRNGSVEIGFPVGKRYTDYQVFKAGTWSRDHLDTRITLINGITYVPLAYTAKKLGLSVTYNSKLRSAIITTNGNQYVALSNPDKPTDEELHWLYQITEAEAGGEKFDGKVAVAATILNRVNNPDWPNSIIDTIFQVEYYEGKSYYQFSPVLDKRIYNVKPSEETKRAVNAAINGLDPSFGAVVFYNPNKTSNAWVRSRPVTTEIGNHVFAK